MQGGRGQMSMVWTLFSFLESARIRTDRAQFLPRAKIDQVAQLRHAFRDLREKRKFEHG